MEESLRQEKIKFDREKERLKRQRRSEGPAHFTEDDVKAMFEARDKRQIYSREERLGATLTKQERLALLKYTQYMTTEITPNIFEGTTKIHVLTAKELEIEADKRPLYKVQVMFIQKYMEKIGQPVRDIPYFVMGEKEDYPWTVGLQERIDNFDKPQNPLDGPAYIWYDDDDKDLKIISGKYVERVERETIEKPKTGFLKRFSKLFNEETPTEDRKLRM
jgi:hypothetical protein